jgi:hypothetical protein
MVYIANLKYRSLRYTKREAELSPYKDLPALFNRRLLTKVRRGEI